MKSWLKLIGYIFLAYVIVSVMMKGLRFISELILQLTNMKVSTFLLLAIGLVLLVYGWRYLQKTNSPFFMKVEAWIEHIIPKVKKKTKSSVYYMQAFVNRLEMDIVQTLSDLKDQQQKLKDYVKSLKQLQAEMMAKEAEIDALRNRLKTLQVDGTEKERAFANGVERKSNSAITYAKKVFCTGEKHSGAATSGRKAATREASA